MQNSFTATSFNLVLINQEKSAIILPHQRRWSREMMRITYQKQNGCIMQRFRNTVLPYRIGDNTSMGWKVLNIEYEYKEKYYSEHDYYRLIQKNKEQIIRKNQIINRLKIELKSFIYSFIVVIIIYSLITLLNI